MANLAVIIAIRSGAYQPVKDVQNGRSGTRLVVPLEVDVEPLAVTNLNDSREDENGQGIGYRPAIIAYICRHESLQLQKILVSFQGPLCYGICL